MCSVVLLFTLSYMYVLLILSNIVHHAHSVMVRLCYVLCGIHTFIILFIIFSLCYLCSPYYDIVHLADSVMV